MDKIIIATRLVVFVSIMGFSATTLAAHEGNVPFDPASNSVPGLDRIKADMSGHFLHMDEGLPVFRDLASNTRVNDANVTSSVREAINGANE